MSGGAFLPDPDLTGLSARERRIFCLGANWAMGAARDAMVAAVRASAARPVIDTLPASSALRAVADGYAAAELGGFVARPGPDGLDWAGDT